MLVVYFMHEFELGVWKALFTHLVRILYAISGSANEVVAELDKRYVLPSLRPKSTRKLTTILKVSTSPYLWKKHDSQIYKRYLRNA
jgi:hypothetical protein